MAGRHNVVVKPMVRYIKPTNHYRVKMLGNTINFWFSVVASLAISSTLEQPGQALFFLHFCILFTITREHPFSK